MVQAVVVCLSHNSVSRGCQILVHSLHDTRQYGLVFESLVCSDSSQFDMQLLVFYDLET